MVSLRRAFLLALPAALLSGCALDLPTGVGSDIVILGGEPSRPAPAAPSAAPAAPSPVAAGSERERVALPLIAAAAARFGLSANLVRAVVAQESSFNPKAVSVSGAQGLMQLMPDTVKHINAVGEATVLDPFDPADNLAGGCWYLAWVHRQVPASVVAADRWAFALAGYNAGIGRVKGLIGSASGASFASVEARLPAETRAYVPKILARWKTYGP